MKVEADLDVTGSWERIRGGSREKLEGHGAGVVGDTVEVDAGVAGEGGQVGQAEEGLEIIVGAELDGEFRFTSGGDGGVEALDYLGCDGRTCDGSDRLARVVGETELVGVGEGPQLG